MKRQIKPIISMAIAAAFLLSACSSATPTAAPIATSAPVETVAPAQTAVAEVPTEAAGTEATIEPTLESAATTEVMTDTGVLTDTEMMTSTPSVDVTPEMTGTEMAGMDSTGTPSASGTDTAMTSTMESTATLDIVETAIATGEFMSLTAALESAGLVETLKGDGPYTVFAPTDEAFAKLDSDTIDMLMDSANQDELVKILTYHVVSGTVMAADVAGMTTADTLEGSPITITVSGGDVMINDAMIVMTDVVASNGVIHVIDTVLMPPDATTP